MEGKYIPRYVSPRLSCHIKIDSDERLSKVHDPLFKLVVAKIVNCYKAVDEHHHRREEDKDVEDPVLNFPADLHLLSFAHNCLLDPRKAICAASFHSLYTRSLRHT